MSDSFQPDPRPGGPPGSAASPRLRAGAFRLRTGDPPVPRALNVAAAWAWRLLILAAGLVAVLWVLGRIQVVVLPIAGALLACTILWPVVAWLDRHGLPRALATVVVLVGAVGVVGGLIAALSMQVRGDLDELETGARDGLAEVEDWLVTGPLGLERRRVGDLSGQLADWFTSPDGLLQAGLLSRAATALEILAGLLLAVVLVFFFLKDGAGMWRWLTRRLGDDAGPHVHEAGMRAWMALGGYIRGQSIVAAIDAVFIGLGVFLLGVPLALPIAILTFVTAFFPIVGAVVAGAVAVLVALAAKGVVTALLVLAIVLAVQQLEGNVLQPVIMSRAVRLHPVVTLVALGAGGALGGIVGAFLAVPIAAAVAAAGGYLWARVGPDPADEIPSVDGATSRREPSPRNG